GAYLRDICEVQTECSMFRAKGAITESIDGRRTLEPAPEPQFFIGIEGQRAARMVHQIAADCVRAVRQAFGILVAGRQQQQLRALDPIRREDEYPPYHPGRVFVRIVVVDLPNAPLR